MQLEKVEKDFNDAMRTAKEETEKALAEIMQARHEQRVAERAARMYANRLQRSIRDMVGVPRKERLDEYLFLQQVKKVLDGRIAEIEGEI